MQNNHSSDGIAEDLIRSFIQIGSAEIHVKTLLEKRISELETGIVDIENDAALTEHLEKIEDLKTELEELAQIRREDMLYLYKLYGEKGDKEKWCTVKHIGIAAMTAFEVWQASNKDEELLGMAIRKNKMFLKAITQFIGVEVTECASCFADILKGGKK